MTRQIDGAVAKPIILPWQGVWPSIHETAFIAPGAVIIGDVVIGAGSSVWFQCTLRGDVNEIRVGENTNIQDHTLVHVTKNGHGTYIGDNIAIGHSCTLHACTLESGCFVGMGATVMDGAVVESRAMVAARAFVTPGKRVPTGELWAGAPAKLMRILSDEDKAEIAGNPVRYAELARAYRDMLAGD